MHTHYSSTRTVFALFLCLVLSACGYNEFQRLDEQTIADAKELLNQYKRRDDLVPNLVATVQGEASFEKDTLTKVIEARAKASSIQVSPETLTNPEAMKKFQSVQGELGGALSRLMVVSERYPTLKANQGFSDLRVQLEGTENRIALAANIRDMCVVVGNYLQGGVGMNPARKQMHQPKYPKNEPHAHGLPKLMRGAFLISASLSTVKPSLVL